KTPATDFKKTQTTPASPLKPWAPEHIPAGTFAYKGPLILQTKPPSEIQIVHELDNERAPSIHEDQHVQFDDTLNAAYEIGSEVEIFMDGEKQMPKRARSSLPSPYGEPGPAVAGGIKKKASEKQKDKAIRE
uniref:Uncharacterized protein n=1 Tax=Panagrolaimus sp. PS1159 TaxID=55785 RepID=A0AC35GCQ3_9BILA